ncbi:GerAB/ArcD/ProY family transporter [Brevibacillus fluminis]|uniref:GerAB/ArcD/ProY family transporter n=1 Tax=Brevibacillus fluminis TaxID=511487 RepID=UPI003F891939
MPGTIITFFQMGMILMMSIGLMNHVIVIPLILSSSGRDAWIAVLCSGAVFVVFTILVVMIARLSKQQPLPLWLEAIYGRFIARFICWCVSLYLFLLALVTLHDTLSWMHVSFAQSTPMIVHVLLFTTICFVNAFAGIRSIAITAGMLLPIVVLLGFFVMTANFHHKDYTYLKPFLFHGWEPVWHGMIFTGAGFSELLVVIFLQHHLKKKLAVLPAVVLAVILVGLTLGPTMGAISEFGPNLAANLRYPAYEQWRLVNIGLYIEHVDFLSIYQWLTGAFIRVSLFFHLIMDLTGLLRRPVKWIPLCFFYLLIVGMMLYPMTDETFLFVLTNYLMPAFLIFSLVASIIFLFTGILSKARERRRATT